MATTDPEKSKSNPPNERVRGLALWLDSYDDIFSDFDSRPYDQRVLSDDFLNEIRKITREDENRVMDLQLLMPSGKRNAAVEDVITKRLHAWFRKNHNRVGAEVTSAQRKGIFFSLTGLILLLAAGYISFAKPTAALLHLLMITCEPAGWFFIWAGYDNLANGKVRRRSELDFYNKMAACRIDFKSLQ
jgi:hypothetical protein